MRQPEQNKRWIARSGPVVAVLSRMGIRRLSAVEFLVVLIAWIISAALLWQLKYGDLIEAVLMTVVMLSALFAVGNRRGTLVVAVLLVTPTFVCKWINHLCPDVMPPEVHMVGALIFMVFLVGHFLRFILRSPRVTYEVLCSAISTYLLMGILWSLAYLLVAEVSPGSFSFFAGPPDRAMKGFEAIYFSFVTLCTVGYGDVIPSSRGAQLLAIAEATAGLFYMTILVARLVSVYSTEKAPDDRGRSATS